METRTDVSKIILIPVSFPTIFFQQLIKSSIIFDIFPPRYNKLIILFELWFFICFYFKYKISHLENHLPFTSLSYLRCKSQVYSRLLSINHSNINYLNKKIHISLTRIAEFYSPLAEFWQTSNLFLLPTFF